MAAAHSHGAAFGSAPLNLNDLLTAQPARLSILSRRPPQMPPAVPYPVPGTAASHHQPGHSMSLSFDYSRTSSVGPGYTPPAAAPSRPHPHTADPASAAHYSHSHARTHAYQPPSALPSYPQGGYGAMSESQARVAPPPRPMLHTTAMSVPPVASALSPTTQSIAASWKLAPSQHVRPSFEGPLPIYGPLDDSLDSPARSPRQSARAGIGDGQLHHTSLEEQNEQLRLQRCRYAELATDAGQTNLMRPAVAFQVASQRPREETPPRARAHYLRPEDDPDEDVQVSSDEEETEWRRTRDADWRTSRPQRSPSRSPRRSPARSRSRDHDRPYAAPTVSSATRSPAPPTARSRTHASTTSTSRSNSPPSTAMPSSLPRDLSLSRVYELLDQNESFYSSRSQRPNPTPAATVAPMTRISGLQQSHQREGFASQSDRDDEPASDLDSSEVHVHVHVHPSPTRRSRRTLDASTAKRVSFRAADAHVHSKTDETETNSVLRDHSPSEPISIDDLSDTRNDSSGQQHQSSSSILSVSREEGQQVPGSLASITRAPLAETDPERASRLVRELARASRDANQTEGSAPAAAPGDALRTLKQRRASKIAPFEPTSSFRRPGPGGAAGAANSLTTYTRNPTSAQGSDVGLFLPSSSVASSTSANRLAVNGARHAQAKRAARAHESEVLARLAATARTPRPVQCAVSLIGSGGSGGADANEKADLLKQLARFRDASPTHPPTHPPRASPVRSTATTRARKTASASPSPSASPQRIKNSSSATTNAMSTADYAPTPTLAEDAAPTHDSMVEPSATAAHLTNTTEVVVPPVETASTTSMAATDPFGGHSRTASLLATPRDSLGASPTMYMLEARVRDAATTPTAPKESARDQTRSRSRSRSASPRRSPRETSARTTSPVENRRNRREPRHSRSPSTASSLSRSPRRRRSSMSERVVSRSPEHTHRRTGSTRSRRSSAHASPRVRSPSAGVTPRSGRTSARRSRTSSPRPTTTGVHSRKTSVSESSRSSWLGHARQESISREDSGAGARERRIHERQLSLERERDLAKATRPHRTSATSTGSSHSRAASHSRHASRVLIATEDEIMSIGDSLPEDTQLSPDAPAATLTDSSRSSQPPFDVVQAVSQRVLQSLLVAMNPPHAPSTAVPPHIPPLPLASIGVNDVNTASTVTPVVSLNAPAPHPSSMFRGEDDRRSERTVVTASSSSSILPLEIVAAKAEHAAQRLMTSRPTADSARVARSRRSVDLVASDSKNTAMLAQKRRTAASRVSIARARAHLDEVDALYHESTALLNDALADVSERIHALKQEVREEALYQSYVALRRTKMAQPVDDGDGDDCDAAPDTDETASLDPDSQAALISEISSTTLDSDALLAHEGLRDLMDEQRRVRLTRCFLALKHAAERRATQCAIIDANVREECMREARDVIRAWRHLAARDPEGSSEAVLVTAPRAPIPSAVEAMRHMSAVRARQTLRRLRAQTIKGARLRHGLTGLLARQYSRTLLVLWSSWRGGLLTIARERVHTNLAREFAAVMHRAREFRRWRARAATESHMLWQVTAAMEAQRRVEPQAVVPAPKIVPMTSAAVASNIPSARPASARTRTTAPAAMSNLLRETAASALRRATVQTTTTAAAAQKKRVKSAAATPKQVSTTFNAKRISNSQDASSANVPQASLVVHMPLAQMMDAAGQLSSLFPPPALAKYAVRDGSPMESAQWMTSLAHRFRSLEAGHHREQIAWIDAQLAARRGLESRIGWLISKYQSYQHEQEEEQRVAVQRTRIERDRQRAMADIMAQRDHPLDGGDEDAWAAMMIRSRASAGAAVRPDIPPLRLPSDAAPQQAPPPPSQVLPDFLPAPTSAPVTAPATAATSTVTSARPSTNAIPSPIVQSHRESVTPPLMSDSAFVAASDAASLTSRTDEDSAISEDAYAAHSVDEDLRLESLRVEAERAEIEARWIQARTQLDGLSLPSSSRMHSRAHDRYDHNKENDDESIGSDEYSITDASSASVSVGALSHIPEAFVSESATEARQTQSVAEWLRQFDLPDPNEMEESASDEESEMEQATHSQRRDRRQEESEPISHSVEARRHVSTISRFDMTAASGEVSFSADGTLHVNSIDLATGQHHIHVHHFHDAPPTRAQLATVHGTSTSFESEASSRRIEPPLTPQPQQPPRAHQPETKMERDWQQMRAEMMRPLGHANVTAASATRDIERRPPRTHSPPTRADPQPDEIDQLSPEVLIPHASVASPVFSSAAAAIGPADSDEMSEDDWRAAELWTETTCRKVFRGWLARTQLLALARMAAERNAMAAARARPHEGGDSKSDSRPDPELSAALAEPASSAGRPSSPPLHASFQSSTGRLVTVAYGADSLVPVYPELVRTERVKDRLEASLDQAVRDAEARETGADQKAKEGPGASYASSSHESDLRQATLDEVMFARFGRPSTRHTQLQLESVLLKKPVTRATPAMTNEHRSTSEARLMFARSASPPRSPAKVRFTPAPVEAKAGRDSSTMAPDDLRRLLLDEAAIDARRAADEVEATTKEVHVPSTNRPVDASHAVPASSQPTVASVASSLSAPLVPFTDLSFEFTPSASMTSHFSTSGDTRGTIGSLDVSRVHAPNTNAVGDATATTAPNAGVVAHLLPPSALHDPFRPPPRPLPRLAVDFAALGKRRIPTDPEAAR